MLDALPNTRDLGYLSTVAGEQLKKRKLIRSGAMAAATKKDIDVLVEDYDVRIVIDLRTLEECQKKPDPQDSMPRTHFVHAPILGFSATGVTHESGLEGMTKTLAVLDSDPKQLMLDIYSSMLLDETGVLGYTRFFEVLAQSNEGSVLWHCSAGKDRAGLASVLLLSALGVARETIVSDYLATNSFLMGRSDDLKRLIPSEYLSESIIQGLQVFNSVNETFLDAGIKAVEKEYGSLDGYLKNALKVDDDMRATLHSKYLCPEGAG